MADQARQGLPGRLIGVAAVLVTVAASAGVLRSGVGARPVSAGSQAPDFLVADVHGGEVTLATFAGKVLLLNVWATWCAPCREEMPSMQRLYDLFGRDDFEIAAVSIDAPQAGIRSALGGGGDPVAFADELGLTFPILLDPEGEIQRVYRTYSVPESFLIGRDGYIYKKVAGATRWDSPTNIELVRRLVDGAGTGAPATADRDGSAPAATE